MSVGPDDRLAWLHGWPWQDSHAALNMGTAFYCVGCGKFFGTGAVVFPEEWEPPGPEPTWPFPEESCPLCAMSRKDSDLHDKVSRYEAVLYAHGIPLSTLPSQPLSKAQREAIRRNLP